MNKNPVETLHATSLLHLCNVSTFVQRLYICATSLLHLCNVSTFVQRLYRCVLRTRAMDNPFR